VRRTNSERFWDIPVSDLITSAGVDGYWSSVKVVCEGNNLSGR